ncbi:putative laccase 2d [Mycena alexandri]|uniref:laccase n=1 Tax=Mycena alexandri TaxID=1745969 RepID=A0AAD6SBP0_9AGAR|nr:putative laccase 2d [Mycena alexandri]
MLVASVLAALTLVSSALSEQKVFNLDIVNAQLAPDGFMREQVNSSTVVPNGTFPGPTFKLNKGDSVVIHTHNKHWHGFFQARTSAMDGPSYWYHSHLSTQYCDGLRDPDDPLAHLYDVDDDSTIITLADWYRKRRLGARELHPEFSPQIRIINASTTALINGVGRYNGGQLVPYAVISVKHGLRYRFRIFSLSCRPYMTFSIDNHTFDVMELDGVEHDPTPFQNADIYAAQRLSIIVTANQSIDNYWVVNPNLTLAILRYEGAAEVEPTTVNVPGAKLDDSLMHPIASEGPGKLGSGPPGFAMVLNISNTINPPFFDINGIVSVPFIVYWLTIIQGKVVPISLAPCLVATTQRIPLPPNTIVDITIPGTGMHGHNFDVVVETDAVTPNYVNPPRRDVVPINGGNTTFRFFSGNPGEFLFYRLDSSPDIHIDWHLEAGLAVVFGESPSANIAGPQSQIQTPDWKQLCPTYDDLAPELQ